MRECSLSYPVRRHCHGDVRSAQRCLFAQARQDDAHALLETEPADLRASLCIVNNIISREPGGWRVPFQGGVWQHPLEINYKHCHSNFPLAN